MRIKTKLSIGTGFLFFVILLFGILSLISVYRLKNDSGQILKNNYETLLFCNSMQDALDMSLNDPLYLDVFEQNLRKQELNITEIGEKQATEKLRKSYNALRSGVKTDSVNFTIRRALVEIISLNQAAIFRKNEVARHTAEIASTWLMIIFTVLILITFTMAVNFPTIISAPIRTLNEGITAIVNKNYRKRIYLKQRDEFGELANAFNTMAEKLDEYEHGNIAQLTFEKSRIETIINQMNDGIIGLDENHQVLFLNEVAQKLLGLKQSEMAGVHTSDIALYNDLMRTLMQDRRTGRELNIFNHDKEHYFQVEFLNVRNEGKQVGEVIILRNVTPFHELSEARTNFIATVSHELKTPIAAIKISTDLLNDQRVGDLNSEQRQLVASISEDADRLLRITSELLNMSQVETGKIKLTIQAVSCNEIITDAIGAVQHMLHQKNIQLHREIYPDLPLALADREKASWVLINYLTNAIRHSDVNSQIILKVNRDKHFIRFQVKDLGSGIDEKYLPQVFDRYFKIPGSFSPDGSGLGLAISKEFIEAQSGRVWVESERGRGSIFGFELPAEN